MKLRLFLLAFILMAVWALIKSTSDLDNKHPNDDLRLVGEQAQKEEPPAKHPALTESAKPERPVLENRREVSRTTWTKGEWPLKVDKGKVDCITFTLGNREYTAAVFIDDKGRKWALNGMAQTHGYGGDIEPIWKLDDSDLWDQLEDQAKREGWLDEYVRPRVNIESLLQHTLSLCE